MPPAAPPAVHPAALLASIGVVMSGTQPLLRALVASLFVLSLAATACAQSVSKADFRTNFTKAFEFGDEKLMDKWMKRQDAPTHAVLYFEELYAETMGGNVDNSKKTDALAASWERSFDGSSTLQRVRRWMDSIDGSTYKALNNGRSQSAKLWRGLADMAAPTREELLQIMEQYAQLARNARSLGHMVEVADLLGLAGVVGARIDKSKQTIADRQAIVAISEEYLAAREAWDFTFDHHYINTKQFVKDSKARIAEDEKKADKRREEGYEGEVKGVDSYLMPNVAAKKLPLEYAPMKSWDKELDLGPKNGKFPPLWWSVNCGENGTSSKLAWFQRRDVYFGRLGGNKFVIARNPDDLKKGDPIHVSSKPKPSTFYLDEDENVPYTMFFWVGSDRERVGLAECNLAPRSDFVLSYYRSGASWQAKVDKETLTFYDDNCNGSPGDANVWELGLKVNTLGEHEGDGTPVPHLDSMKVGRTGRGPYSEFVKLASGWVYLQVKGDHVEYRPLNPEYFKTGKIKLKWEGPKQSRPAQLVVQGKGDFKTAMFDIADGKEVELPAGEYSVIFGRIAIGKGSRVQNATIYGGDSQPFEVEAGATKELVMGAPFRIKFERDGDKQVSIDALKIFPQDSFGLVFTELHGMGIEPEVVAAKSEDGKGAKVVGEFQQFTDGELVNVAGQSHKRLSTLCALFPKPEGYRSGPLVLKVDMPATGMKLGLRQKKHAVFGKLEPSWQ